MQMSDDRNMNENHRKSHLPLEDWADYRESVRAELELVIDRTLPPLRGIMRYHMGWENEQGDAGQPRPGKFVRAILHMLSCGAVGGDAAQTIPAAAALELIHNFSLIHDDIQDGSHERRGRPTVWALWGTSQAINVGDFLFALASLALLRLGDHNVPGEDIVHSFQLLAEACKDLCEGQYLDLEFEKRVDITLEDYLGMVRRKTAALIAASTSMGAHLGGGGERVSHFHRFGEALGIAYQISDDILGIWGVKKTTGKSVEADLRQRKKTLPVVYALRESKDRATLAGIYSANEIKGSDIPVALEILDRSGAREYAQGLVEGYFHQALVQLEASGVGADRSAPLVRIAQFLREREY